MRVPCVKHTAVRVTGLELGFQFGSHNINNMRCNRKKIVSLEPAKSGQLKGSEKENRVSMLDLQLSLTDGNINVYIPTCL